MRKLPDTFPKDRRFLMAMSVIVMAFYVLDASVKSQVEQFGLLFNIEKASHFVWGLWAVWIYAALRYWHTFFAYFDAIRGRILSEISRRQTQITRRAAVREAKKLARTGKFGAGFLDAIPFLDTLQQMRDVDGMNPEDAQQLLESKTIFFSRQPDGSGKFSNLTITFGWPSTPEGYRSESVDFALLWSVRKRKWVRFRSWFSALWNMPALVEYVAPFIVIALTLATPWQFPRSMRDADFDLPARAVAIPEPKSTAPAGEPVQSQPIVIPTN